MLNFFKTKQMHADYSINAMEADTILKNGRNPKRLMSRGKQLKIKNYELKILTLLVAMLFSVASAFAQGGETGPLTWNISGNTLTISGDGAMPDYNLSDNKAPWNDYYYSIKTVIMENGVKSIGNYAFFSYSMLTSVTIPDGINKIGDFAFGFCTSLPSILIPNSVTTIGMSAFNACQKLISITIPESVITIGNVAFFLCTSLTSIDVDSGNNNYASENGVLFDKNKTTLICYPAGKTDNTYDIFNSVTSIVFNAFAFCHLSSITIPNSVTTIGALAFYRCESMVTINVDSENNNYASENGVLFNKNKTTLICCPAGKTEKCVIPNSVKSIEVGAFDYCKNLTSVTIPNSATSIGGYAFRSCENLILITNFNPNPVEIDQNVFEGMDKSKCTLEVPMNSVSKYKNADVWKEFNIVGIEVGIETIESDVVKIYPNPTNGQLIIENGQWTIENIEIFDVMGKSAAIVETWRAASLRQPTTTIDISHLPSGIYFVRIQTENGMVTRKIIKK